MEFTITITAPREKVWDTLWNNTTYPQWTAPFSEGSRAETDWKKGSRILFLDKNNAGMVATVMENIPNEFMSIKHLGSVKDGVEDFESEAAKQWAGGLENYTLRTVKGQTELFVEMSGITIPKEFEDYFLEAWPKALNALKEISEKK